MLVRKNLNSKLLGLLTLTAAVMVLFPSAGNAGSSDADQDQQSGPVHSGRGIVPMRTTDSSSAPSPSPFQLFNWSAPGQAQPKQQAIQPVPIFDNSTPPSAPTKFQSRVQAAQLNPTPLGSSAPAPTTPTKYKAMVNPEPVSLGPIVAPKYQSRVSADQSAPPVAEPPAPTKYQSRVSASQVTAPVIDPTPIDTAPPVVQTAPAPPTPTKYQSLVQASSAAPPAPVMQPPAPVVDQAQETDVGPAPLAAPPTPTKFSSRVKAQEVAPAPIAAPPAPTKYQSRVTTAPSTAPTVPAKFASRVAADQVETVSPDQTEATAPTAPLSQTAAPVASATACPSPISTNGVTQATDLSKTLNQTLAQVKPKQVAMNDDLENPLSPHETLASSNCALNLILQAAKKEVATRWGNRNRGGGKCAFGVRESLQRSGVGGIHDGIGNAINFVTNLKHFGFVTSGTTDVSKAPAGSVIVFAGPCSPGFQNLATGDHSCSSQGDRLGHVTIKGDDGYFYTDGRTKNAAIGWVGSKNVSHRRNVAAIFVPGPSLVSKFANKCPAH